MTFNTFVSEAASLMGFFRLIGIWTQLNVFVLVVLSNYDGSIRVLVLSLTIVVLIFDVTILFMRRKARKSVMALNHKYTLQPKIWILACDLFVGVAFLVAFILRESEADIWLYRSSSSPQIAEVSCWASVGILVVAHIHLFFGSIETWILQHQRSGKIPITGAGSRAQGENEKLEDLVARILRQQLDAMKGSSSAELSDSSRNNDIVELAAQILRQELSTAGGSVRTKRRDQVRNEGLVELAAAVDGPDRV